MACSCLLMLWVFLSDMIVNRINDIEQSTGIAGIFVIFLFSLTTFARAVEFPCYIRFGKKNGNKYRSVALFAIFLLITVYVLFGDLSIFMSKEAFSELVMYIAAPDPSMDVPPIIKGITTFVYLFPAISFVAYYFSYKISVKLYKKGVECYDK